MNDPPADIASQGLWASLPWLVLFLVPIVAGGVTALWILVSRLSILEQSLQRLERLEDLALSVNRLAEAHGDLDLRRLEHVMIDIRDGQRRVEDSLLRVIESTTKSNQERKNGAAAGPEPADLAERVVNRLLALGYERIQLVTPVEELTGMLVGDGEVFVEARRDGANCKGRVLVRAGAITEAQLRPAYTVFP